MMAAIICRETGWDYWTYQAQPRWLVDLIFELINKRYG